MNRSSNPYDTGELINNSFPLSAYSDEYLRMRVMALAGQIMRGVCTPEKAAELMHMKTSDFCDLFDKLAGSTDNSAE